MGAVRFFSEKIRFTLPHPRKTASWIKQAIQNENKELINLNYIFCGDDYLYRINVQYLHHHTFTDIITFDHSEKRNHIEGDIYISIDRVRENSSSLKVDFDTELHRVIIHGALHLMGYRDKKPSEKTRMREKEDAYLSLRH
jgi:probable rRNA maturation factor